MSPLLRRFPMILVGVFSLLALSAAAVLFFTQEELQAPLRRGGEQGGEPFRGEHGDRGEGEPLAEEAGARAEPVGISPPSLQEPEDRVRLRARGSGTFVLEGRVKSRDGAPLPEGLEITALGLAPPFTPVHLRDLGRAGRFVAVTEEALRASTLPAPPARVAPDGSFRLEGLPDRTCRILPRNAFLRPAGDRTLRPRPEAVAARGETVSLPTVFLERGGVVKGCALDSKGRPVPRVQVTLKGAFDPFLPFSGKAGIPAPFTLSADEEGRFRFAQVPARTPLELVVKAKGFAPLVRKEIEVHPGETVELSLTLTPGARIGGAVRFADGKPAPGVKVELLPGKLDFSMNLEGTAGETETDREGMFLFSGLAAGAYTVRLASPEYARAVKKGVAVGAGEERRDLRFVLEPGLEITGRVEDGAGRALPGARIRVTRPFDLARLSRFVESRMQDLDVRSEADGRFRIAGLEEGTWALEVRAEGYPLLKQEAQAGTKDLVIRLKEGGEIAGIVVSTTRGEAVQSYTVDMEWVSEGGRTLLDPFGLQDRARRTVRDDQGKFRFTGLVPGRYTLTFQAGGFGRRKVEGVKVEAGRPVRGLIVALPEEAAVSGTVLDGATGRPVEGARLSLKSGIEGMLSEYTGGGRAAYTDLEGGFRVGGLGPGRVRLVVTHPLYRRTTTPELYLAEGEHLDGVVVRLHPGAVIQGTVRTADRSPAEGVRLLASPPSGMGIRSARTDREGHYAIGGLDPGTYNVTLLPSGLDLWGGDFMGSLLRDMETRTVRVEEDETKACDFVIGVSGGGGTLLQGTVRAAGLPVHGVILNLVPLGGKAKAVSLRNAVTDEAGRYRFPGVEPGTYSLRAVRFEEGGTGSAAFTVEVRDLPEQTFDCSLPGGVIAGTVRDRDTGSPLASVRITVRRTDAAPGTDPLAEAMGGRVGEVYTDGKGRFTVTALEPGTYTVTAGGAGPLGMGRGSYAAERLEGIHLAGNEAKDDLEILLEEGGTLEGEVTDGNGHPIVGAALFTEREGEAVGDTFSEILTDGTGRYRYPGLAAGTWTVLARHSDHAPVIRSGIRIVKGETRTLNLVMAAGTAVYVRVLDGEGSVLTGTVQLHFYDTAGHDFCAYSDLLGVMDSFLSGGGEAGGPAYLGRFAAGTYRLEVLHPAAGKKNLDVHLAPGEEDHLVTVTF